jgi:hypothetical protein
MAVERNFGVATGTDIAGNDIEWKAILDDNNLGTGEDTHLHVELYRPLGAGALPAPGATITIIKFPFGLPVRVTPPGPDIASDDGNTLAESARIQVGFQITNEPAPTGVTPATYSLLAVLEWPVGNMAVAPLMSVP